MSDFPSISNLTNQTTKGSNATSPQTKFASKMKQIQKGELEKNTAEQAAELGLPYIDLSGFPVPAEALKTIPLATAEKYQTICFYSTPEELRLGIVNPTEEIKELTFQLGEKHHAKVLIYLITKNSFDRVIKLYSNLPIVKPVSKDFNITDEDLNHLFAS